MEHQIWSTSSSAPYQLVKSGSTCRQLIQIRHTNTNKFTRAKRLLQNFAKLWKIGANWFNCISVETCANSSWFITYCEDKNVFDLLVCTFSMSSCEKKFGRELCEIEADWFSCIIGEKRAKIF